MRRDAAVDAAESVAEAVAAPDGILLATEVYRPVGAGPWPVVLLRTYHAEREDGRATVEWLLGQAWCDGRVAAVGGSYAAFSAWSAALGHSAVRAVISSVPAMRPMPMLAEDGGVFPLLSRICWWATHAGSREARPDSLATSLARGSEALRQLPVVDLPSVLEAELPGWQDELGRLEEDAERSPISRQELARLDVATLHVGGWHDPFCSETLRHFEEVGSALTPRPERAMVIGPWWHQLGGHRPASYGERCYGPRSRFRLGDFQAEWLSDALRDEAEVPASENPTTSKAAAHVFLGGANRWLADGWLERPVIGLKLFGTGGELRGRPPEKAGKASFDYDPERPRACGRTPLDEREVPAGEDVIVMTSAPLADPCAIVGSPRLTLWASTDQRSADWVARLLEVTADGRRLYLAHGLLDAARALEQRGETLAPNAVHRFEIRLSPVGFEIPAGHRLRLEITGSAFPSYARNLGSGASRLLGDETRRCVQTVFWGPERGLVLELPIHVQLAHSSSVDMEEVA